MVVDQQEIDDLLSEADGLRTETEKQVDGVKEDDPGQTEKPATSGVDASADLYRGTSAEVRRALRVRVPAIVQLAGRRMPIAKIRMLSNGAIIEFDKSVDDDLELFIRNRRIGRGRAVKVGEQFGLRVTEIGTRRERIESMGTP